MQRPTPAGLCGRRILLSPLVAHARKEAVNGEAVWQTPRVEFLVGVLVRHAQRRSPLARRDGMYDLVPTQVKNYVPLLIELWSRVRANCYRPRLARCRGVKVAGVHQIIAERPRAASRRKAIPFEGVADQVRARHTDVVKVPSGRRVALTVLAPH